MIKISDLPKILVISHTSFTRSDSMGSTLASYFTEYGSDSLAQFYIKEMEPDIPVCRKYYRVTDSEVFKAAFTPFSGKPLGKRTVLDLSGDHGDAAKKDTKSGNLKNRALRMLIRSVVWNLSRFEKKGFDDFVNEFAPDAVLVQPGDFGYLLKLATKISKRRNIPLIVHQSEAYYLKPYYSKRLSYLIYRLNFKHSYEKMMKRACACIYLCDALQKDYEKLFDVPSVTIYKSTDIIPQKHEGSGLKSGFRCIYGGNLGEAVGRAQPLCELGKVIKKCGGFIDVYSASTGEHLKDLNEENGIIMHGAVSAAQLADEINRSDFVIHVENQSDWHRIDEKYAFSTKIADMLACGRPTVIYGSTEVAGIKYFADNNLGLVIEKKEDLYPEIEKLIKNADMQDEFVERALKFAKENHDPKKNSEKTKEVILKVFEQ